MQQGQVFRNKRFVGIISKEQEDSYLFKYDEEYLKWENAKAISLNLPLQEEAYESRYLFPFFSNMLAEGSLKDIQCMQS